MLSKQKIANIGDATAGMTVDSLKDELHELYTRTKSMMSLRWSAPKYARSYIYIVFHPILYREWCRVIRRLSSKSAVRTYLSLTKETR